MSAATATRLPPLRDRCAPARKPAAAMYADRSAQLWGRLRTLEAQVGDHAALAMAADELNRGAAWGYAGDLERVNALLGEAIAILGGAA